MKRFFIFSLMLIILVGLVFFPLAIVSNYEDQIYFDVNNVPEKSVAIVFGAGVLKNGNPSDVLKDRLNSAKELYDIGKVKKIIVSGDNRFENYNEPESMFNYLVNVAGVPAEDISQDFAGRRTFDTCKRAKEIWNVSDAVLVTQTYHLPRALFTCTGLGIDTVGYSATKQEYVMSKYYYIREFVAKFLAFKDVYIWEPSYIGGGKESL